MNDAALELFRSLLGRPAKLMVEVSSLEHCWPSAEASIAGLPVLSAMPWSCSEGAD